MGFSACLRDGSIGPFVQGCRDDFDFTISFELLFFALIPTAIFLALCIPRTVYLIRRPAIVGGALFQGVKLTAICVYAGIQLSLLILSCFTTGSFKALLISASAVTFLSALCMGWLSHLEHSRSLRSSILLTAYMFVSTLLQIAQARTFWLASKTSEETIFCRLFTVGVVAKVFILILESQHKSKWIRWDTKEHSPEETTGLFGLGAFLWLNKLFLMGYRKVLALDDLYPLDRSLCSEDLKQKLEARIESPISQGPGKKHGLAKALAKTLAVQLLMPIGPRVAMGAFQLCQPFLINTLLDYLQQPTDADNIGYGLIGATVLVYVGIAVSGAFYWYFQERAMYTARGVLASVLYQKTVNSSLVAQDSAVLTLMSADIERVIRGCLNIHEFWANTIQVGLACWLLSNQIGTAFVAPLIVVGCCIICSTILSRYTGPLQKAWMEKIQKRVGLTSQVIGQMKYLKMSGLAHHVEESIQKRRVDELRTGARFRTILMLSAVLGYTPLCISPVMVFAFTNQTLGVTKIFTSISYILLLASPLGILFQSLPNFLAALTCLNRIQAFLENDSRLDFRRPKQTLRSCERTESQEEKPKDESYKPPSLMEISDGNFGWQANAFNLKGINLNIPKSCLTIVIGPVASGKSTLCKALLGEIPVSEGQVVTEFDPGPIRAGYCDQIPFLTNATIRENIVGFASFNEKRYSEAIEAAMLQHDLSFSLPQGDQTRVGSNGITLSGGQKQRVAIARALYLESSFYIFDDVLSGLDTDTEEEVFRKVFSAEGLLRRRNATVVLCTHSLRHLPSADQIVALDTSGKIVEQGTFHELLANEKYVHGLGIKQSATLHSEDSLTTVDENSPARAKPLQAPISKSPASNPIQQEQGRMLGDLSVYRHYFSRIKTSSIIVLLVSGLGWGFFYNFTTVWLKFWSDDVSSTSQTYSNSFYLGLYALFQISTLASLFFVSRICFKTIVLVSGARLHKEALRTVINAPLKFFATTDTGVVTNLFSQDMTLIDGQLPMSMANLALYSFSSLGMAAVIAASSPFIIITYPFLGIMLYGIQKFYLRTSRQIRLLDLEAKNTIRGIITIRAFDWVSDNIETNSRLLNTSQRPAYLLAIIQRWLGFMLQLIVAVLAVGVVTLATQLGSNTAVTGASLVMLMSFSEGLSYIVTMYTMLETSIGAVYRLRNFSEKVKSESLEGEDISLPPGWPARGHVSIEGVSASYLDDDEETSRISSSSRVGGNNASSRRLAIKDLTLNIAGGEKIAICGRSGSGKSSLILLLLRLLDPLPSDVANITIDDIPLHKVDRSTLRQCIIAVPQDTVFLPEGTSFQTNLDISTSTATESDCQAALETVGLWTFVQQHGGLSAGMGAETLSQGQKQLFSLARAILRRRAREKNGQSGSGSGENSGTGVKGGILILDEINSSLDRDTDQAIQEIIRKEFDNYTIIMVSHRLDTVMEFDTVVVFDEGIIVELGRPRTLVERQGSKFRDLWLIGNHSI